MNDPSQMRCPACNHSFPSVLSPDVEFHSDSGVLPPMHITEECPRCGAAVTRIETSESFTLAEGPIRLRELLRPAGATPEDYRQLAEALRDALDQGATPQQTVNAVGSVPVFSELKRLVQRHPETARWLVALLVTVLFNVLNLSKPSSTPPESSSTPTIIVNEYGPDPRDIEREIGRQVREGLAAYEQGRRDQAEQDRCEGSGR